MAQESSDKPNDSVPDNPPSSNDESASPGPDSTPESPASSEIDNWLNRAEDSLTDVDDQLTNPSESDKEESLPSDTQGTDRPVGRHKSSPVPQPPMPQDKKINQTLNNLEQDMQSLAREVGEKAEEVVQNDPDAVDDILSQLPDMAGGESEEQDTSPADSLDTDSTEEPSPAENIDDMLSSFADEMQDVEQNQHESKTNSAQPSDTAPPETTAEDEQVAKDEIDTVLAQTASPDPERHVETDNDRQQDHSAPADELPPAKEKTSPTDSEEEEDFTTLSQSSSPPPQAIPVTADENSIQRARADAASTQKENKLTPEDLALFPLPQRLLIKSLVAINKPFAFLPEKFKHLLGIAAVVTILLSLIAAALILFMLD